MIIKENYEELKNKEKEMINENHQKKQNYKDKFEKNKIIENEKINKSNKPQSYSVFKY